MALLRWIHLRKLVPIEDLIAGADRRRCAGPSRTAPASASARRAWCRRHRRRACGAAAPRRRAASRRPPAASGSSRPRARRRHAAAAPNLSPAPRRRPATSRTRCSREIRKAKMVFYNTVVAQAQKIEVAGDRVTFTFSPTQRALRDQFEQNRAWLESIAQQVAGRKMIVVVGCRPTAPRRRRPPRRRAAAPATQTVGRQEIGASRAGARRRRRAGAARSLSRGDPRRRGNVNIQDR